jgi:SAM-dependent methyltransferase
VKAPTASAPPPWVFNDKSVRWTVVRLLFTLRVFELGSGYGQRVRPFLLAALAYARACQQNALGDSERDAIRSSINEALYTVIEIQREQMAYRLLRLRPISKHELPRENWHCAYIHWAEAHLLDEYSSAATEAAPDACLSSAILSVPPAAPANSAQEATGGKKRLVANVYPQASKLTKAERDLAIKRAPANVRWFYEHYLLRAAAAIQCGLLEPTDAQREAIQKADAALKAIRDEQGDNWLETQWITKKAKASSHYSDLVDKLLGTSTRGSTRDQPVIFSAHRGDNADLIRDAMVLHVTPGAKIADVTFNSGKFWKKTNLAQYDFHRSDLYYASDDPAVQILRADFRDLPYKNDDFDAIVFDPPYRISASVRPLDCDDNYGNNSTAIHEGATTYPSLLARYEQGAREAFRVLRPGGKFFVKCQDVVTGNKLRLTPVDIHDRLTSLGFQLADKFVLLSNGVRPRAETGTQRHARRSDSTLLVFLKPRRPRKRLVATAAQAA